MIKKYNKILFTTLLFFLLLFLINITTVSAKEVTLDELAEKVIEVKPDTTYLYIIGEYAFTSDHILTTQDIMLAARSIKVSENCGATNSDAIYNEMTIMYVEGTYDSDWNLTGLEYVSNLVGTTEPGEKYEIKYIDYDGEVFSKIDVDQLVDEAFNTIDTTASNDKFEVSKTGNTINVTVLDNSMNSIEALAGTGIATAAENILNEYGIKTVTLAIPGTSVEITAENLLEKLGDLNALFEALAGTTNAQAGDLAGKSITVTLGLEEGCTTEDATTFTVTFDKKEVEVSKLVDEAYNTIDTTAANDKFEVSKEGNTITVTVLQNNMNSVEALSGTGIGTAAENLLNEYGVKTVTLAIPGTETSVEITAENLLEKLGELNELFTTLAGTTNAVAGNLAGKSITVTLGLEEGCTTEDETSFTVTFDKKEVEVSELVDEAFNTIDTTAANEKFEVSKNGNTISVTVLENSMNSIEALAGTGIATAAENLLNEYGVKTVTLAIPGTESSVEVTAENLLEKLGDLNALFEALAGTTNAQAGDLAGKSITITLGLEEGCTTEDATTFTVTFDKKEVEVSELVDEAFNTIDTTVANDKFEVSKNGNTISVTVLENSMNSIEALAGTGIATAAENLLNEYGVKTVTLAIPGTSVEITAENLLEKLGDLNALFEALAGTTNAQAGDLAGKSITITLGLEEGCTTEDATTFTVTFDKKEEVNVSELVDDVYSTIDTTTANDKFEVSKGADNTINVTILETEMDSVTALGGTGIVAAAENLLNEEAVKTVTLSIPGTESSVVVASADELILKMGEFDALFIALAGKENAQAGDLAGKSITVTIALEEGYTTNDATSFTVTFN